MKFIAEIEVEDNVIHQWAGGNHYEGNPLFLFLIHAEVQLGKELNNILGSDGTGTLELNVGD